MRNYAKDSIHSNFGLKLEREEDAIFYGRLFRANVTPQLIKFGRKWLWRY